MCASWLSLRSVAAAGREAERVPLHWSVLELRLPDIHARDNRRVETVALGMPQCSSQKRNAGCQFAFTS